MKRGKERACRYGTLFCDTFKILGLNSGSNDVNGQIDQNMAFRRKHTNISRTGMRTPKTAMERLQNPVSKRNNVIDLRFVLPHFFVLVLQ